MRTIRRDSSNDNEQPGANRTGFAGNVRAAIDPRPPFRIRVGHDDKIAAAAKSLLPFRARAAGIRKIIGLPSRPQSTTAAN